MPKGYRRNGEKLGFKKGYKQSESFRAACYPNRIPWNKGRKGVQVAWNKGIKGIPWTEARRKAQILVVSKRWAPERRGCIKVRPIIKNGREYSPFWHEIRKLVYKRDGYLCQECGVHCHNDKKIQCHHIDYDINNNELSNLMTLCSSCHAKTNFKRLDWIVRYTTRMSQKLI